MKIICSYCRTCYGEKEPLEDKRISHGMCEACFDHFQRQQDGLPLDEYLDGFDSPVLIVNQEGRIAAANQAAKDMLGAPNREITGLLSGEAMECCYARLPAGCGKTLHCETCTIRKTIMHTLQTGTPMKKAPVKVTRNGVERDLVISSDRVDGLIRVEIEK